MKRKDDLLNSSFPSLFAKLQADLVSSETNNLVFRPGFPAEAITLLIISSLIIWLVSDSHGSRVTSGVGALQRG